MTTRPNVADIVVTAPLSVTIDGMPYLIATLAIVLIVIVWLAVTLQRSRDRRESDA